MSDPMKLIERGAASLDALADKLEAGQIPHSSEAANGNDTPAWRLAVALAQTRGRTPRRASSGWINTCCPAHEDAESSLGLRDADDGGVVWNCRTGCDPGEVAKAAAKIGIEFPRRTSSRNDKKEKRSTDGGKEEKVSVQTVLDAAAIDKLFRSDDEAGQKVAYARTPEGACYAVESDAYQLLLESRIYETAKCPIPPDVLIAAIRMLRARGLHDKAVCDEKVYLRIAPLGDPVSFDGIVFDIGDDTHDVLVVRAGGWEHVTGGNSPVNFRRAPKMLSLPFAPGVKPNISALRRAINVRPQDWPLVLGFVMQGLRPSGHYPGLLVTGEQGSGKTTTARRLGSLIDPREVQDAGPPRETRDLTVGALWAHLVTHDNLSHIDEELSDALCRLSTGSGVVERRYYTNAGLVTYSVCRPWLLTSIADVVVRGDLADRTLRIVCPPLAEEADEESEEHAEREWRENLPAIFAAVLRGLSMALATWREMRLGTKTRMRDAARWAMAAMPAFGLEPDDYIAAYGRMRDELRHIELEASPVALVLLELLEHGWSGEPQPLGKPITYKELLTQLVIKAGDRARNRAWPRSPKGLSEALKRLAPALAAQGILMAAGDHTERGNTVVFRKKE